MPSQNERRRNNLKTGIFVTVSIGLALASTVIISDQIKVWRQAMDTYQVSFPVASGVSNIQPGAAVQVGGLDLGSVKGVTPVVPVDETEAFEQIIVEFKLARNIPLYEDAKVHINVPILGSGAWLDITDVGTPGEKRATPETVIDGAVSAGGLLGPILGPQNAADFVDDASTFTSFFAEIPERYGPKADKFMEDANATASGMRAAVDDFRERQPGWSGQVDAVLTKTEEMMDVGKGFVLEAQEGVKDVRDLVLDNRPEVDRIVGNTATASDDLKTTMANTREVTTRVKDETMDKFDRVMTKGNEVAQSAADVLNRLKTDYEVMSVRVGETLANATLASQQLKLAIAEVRRSPWKAFYRPSASEVEHELLYDAARSYAVATIDLKAAADSLERLLDQYGDEIRSDPELHERVMRVVDIPLERHTIAQQNLLDLLVEEAQ